MEALIGIAGGARESEFRTIPFPKTEFMLYLYLLAGLRPAFREAARER
jgi:hypothetical protein